VTTPVTVTTPAAYNADHESLGDRQLRQLIDRYVALSGASFVEIGQHLYELKVPSADRATFGSRNTIRLAFSVEAIQADGEAEMAIVGGVFVEQLIAAIRGRGTRFHVGAVGSTETGSPAQSPLPVPVRRGHAREGVSTTARHQLARLTARVVIRAGTALEEHLVDSPVFDMSTGLLLPADVAAECEKALRDVAGRPVEGEAVVSASRPLTELVNQMLASLSAKLEPELADLRVKAQKELAHEVGRIQRYYASLLEDIGGKGTAIPDRAARRVYEADRDRRIDEERDRHVVRAVVHPVQLITWDAAVQRIDWHLEGSSGHRGTFIGQRTLAGDRRWVLGCPNCGGQSPSELLVCVHDHVACAACGTDCSVCQGSFCTAHGITACHIDNAPACEAHARTCQVCLQPHCSSHDGECEDGGHAACITCLGACAICARQICDKHAEMSDAQAPRGARRFCRDCVRKCEGRSNEVVGADEVTGCASCDQVVCERHQASCAVDGKIHCSKHLRRTDRSRRLVCEKDRASCQYEPSAVLARDEVSVCVTCGAQACTTHTAPCVEDQRIHCRQHMRELRDKRGQVACVAHYTVCHIDGVVFSKSGTTACPVCDKLTCRDHTRSCPTCQREVCASDLKTSASCATCSRLAPTDMPADDVIMAANALFERAGRAKSWRTARDARHTVVEADLGWTRRVVFVVRHGDQHAEKAYAKSVMGSRKLA